MTRFHHARLLGFRISHRLVLAAAGWRRLCTRTRPTDDAKTWPGRTCGSGAGGRQGRQVIGNSQVQQLIARVIDEQGNWHSCTTSTAFG